MTDEEIDKIGELMDKLGHELGYANICIVNNYMDDGYFLCVYKNGQPLKDAALIGPSLSDIVKKFKLMKLELNPL